MQNRPEKSEQLKENIRPLPVQDIPPIKKISSQLRRFLKKPEMGHDRAYAALVKIEKDFNKIISMLEKLSHESTDDDVKQLKQFSGAVIKQLNEQIKQTAHLGSVKIDDVFFTEVLSNAKLSLTRISPINLVDLFTLDEIEPENQVVTSDQYQFDVEGLFRFLQVTPWESLANPSTKIKFNEADKQIILKAVKEYAKRENKQVQLCVGNPHEHGDPGYEATMTLVRQFQFRIFRMIPQANRNPFAFSVFRQGNDRQYELATRAARMMRETAQALSQYGLTEGFLRRNWAPRSQCSAQFPNAPDVPFTAFERDILIYLVTGQPKESSPGLERLLPIPAELRLTPEQAIQEINGLDIDQIGALEQNYIYGLRGNHLRNWQPSADGSSFMVAHKFALNELFKEQQHLPQEQRLSPEQIMEKINRKTFDEAMDLFRSFHSSTLRMP